LGFDASDGPAIDCLFTESELEMTDQQIIFSALRQAGFIIASYLEPGPGPRDADEAITQLIAVLDTQELADAMNRVERGFGLRVVK
jgi:hypothetical protein